MVSLLVTFWPPKPGIGETLSLDHFSRWDEMRVSSQSRLRHFRSLSLGLESRKLHIPGSRPGLGLVFSLHTGCCSNLVPLYMEKCLSQSLFGKKWYLVVGFSAFLPKSGSLSTSLSLDPLVSVSISVSNYWTSLVSISVSSLDQTWARSRSRSQSQKCWSRRLLVHNLDNSLPLSGWGLSCRVKGFQNISNRRVHSFGQCIGENSSKLRYLAGLKLPAL